MKISGRDLLAPGVVLGPTWRITWRTRSLPGEWPIPEKTWSAATP
jgi:hypothetical protein